VLKNIILVLKLPT